MQLEKYVRSFVNGRLRVRHPALIGLEGDERQAIEAWVLSVDGITSVSFNPAVGSALLIWDPMRLTFEDLKGYLQGWLEMIGSAQEGNFSSGEKVSESDAQPSEDLCTGSIMGSVKDFSQTMLDGVANVIVPDVKNSKRACRVAQNRIMLGLGSASVASLAFNKAGHGVLGWGFAAFILLHLWQHRRVL